MKYVLKQKREGDHKVYISDLKKFKKHYNWDIKLSLNQIFRDIFLWIIQKKPYTW
jgi:UDP-glucose 4-epimerase